MIKTREEYTIDAVEKFLIDNKRNRMIHRSNIDVIENVISTNNLKYGIDVGIQLGESSRYFLSSLMRNSADSMLVCFDNNMCMEYYKEKVTIPDAGCFKNFFYVEDEFDETLLKNHLLFFEQDFLSVIDMRYRKYPLTTPVFGDIKKYPTKFDFIHMDFIPGHANSEESYNAMRYCCNPKWFELFNSTFYIFHHQVQQQGPGHFQGIIDSLNYLPCNFEFGFMQTYPLELGIFKVTKIRKN